MLKIPPDITFVIQIALFVVFWMLMKRLWFAPALRVIKERNARSEGAVHEARTIEAEVERLRSEHAAALDKVRDEARREMQDMLRNAEVEQKRLINEAREEARRALSEARSRVAEQVAEARQDVHAQAGELARTIVRTLLARATP